MHACMVVLVLIRLNEHPLDAHAHATCTCYMHMLHAHATCTCTCCTYVCQVTFYAFPEYIWGLTLPILAAGYGAHAMHMHMLHMHTPCTSHATYMHTCYHASCSCVRPFRSLLDLPHQAEHDARPDPGNVTRSTLPPSPNPLLTLLTLRLAPPQVLDLPPVHPA